MGKITSAPTPAEVKGTKKKGRPPRNSSSPASNSNKSPTPNSASHRSTRRNPNHSDSPPSPELDDDDDERKEKKVKLVVRLPQSDDNVKLDEKNHHQASKRHFRDLYSGSGSGSDRDSEDRNGLSKKRKISSVGSGSGEGEVDRDKEVAKATDASVHGSSLELASGTPMPDKEILVFILDRLQKKDTYGVFLEPVDPDELPDYFDIIKQPMDFGTLRKKLDDGIYKNLEELEADVFLICSNAMQYNASDTVYYRQARSIQELAKRDFANLKQEGEDGAPQPKVVRRGRPPSSKNQKKPVETFPVDRLTPERSSSAVLANEGRAATSSTVSPFALAEKYDAATFGSSSSHNLRRSTISSRFRSTDSRIASSRPRYGDSDWSTTWNTEFPASIIRADMKHGSKLYAMDENRRDSCTNCPSPADSFRISLNSVIDTRQLVPVGLHEALGYARSLARYAADLGPVAWRIASKKIEAVLPPGVQYGPGWVGDGRPSSSGSAGKTNSGQTLHPPYRNGFTRSFVPEAKPSMDSTPDVKPEVIKSGNDEFQEKNEKVMLEKSLHHQSPVVQRLSGFVSSEMNSSKIPGGSPLSSSERIGSLKNPDLALQLAFRGAESSSSLPEHMDAPASFLAARP